MTETEFLTALRESQAHETRLTQGTLDIRATILVRVFFQRAEAVNDTWQLSIPGDHIVLCVRVGKRHEVIVKLDMPVPKTDLGPGLIAEISNIVRAVETLVATAKTALPYPNLGLGGH